MLVVAAARRTRVPFALLAPAAWLAAEWLRGVGELTFPWGYAGYALVPHPTLLQAASWGGIHGLTLIVLLANVAVWAAVAGRGRAPVRFAPAAAAAVGLLALHAAGAARLRAHPPLSPDDAAVRVAVLQPNIVQTIKWDWEHKDRSLDAIARLSHRIPAGGVALSVWPETAVPAYLHEEPAYFTLVRRIVAGSRTPTLVGFPNTAVVGNEREYYNSAVLFNPDGSEGGEYRKIRLVPFGERLPFQDLFPALRKVDVGESDFTAGRAHTLFSSPAGRFGVSICFEAVYPGMTRRIVRDGGDFLVNITNDAWFGKSSAPWQHARMAMVRAVEDGVSLVRSANTGISLVADPFGRVAAETGLFEETILVEPLDARRVPTFYLEHGDLSLWAALAVAALALAACVAPVPGVARRR
jgi:apolipoprotein N-acyltransferase